MAAPSHTRPGPAAFVAPVDLSADQNVANLPDYVLKHMPKKWYSKMCQCCWHKEGEVALCLECVDNIAEGSSGSDVEYGGEVDELPSTQPIEVEDGPADAPINAFD